MKGAEGGPRLLDLPCNLIATAIVVGSVLDLKTFCLETLEDSGAKTINVN
ncbi:MAG: hypothetical protein AAB590_02155 [Patescibacteria group bacterium]